MSKDQTISKVGCYVHYIANIQEQALCSYLNSYLLTRYYIFIHKKSVLLVVLMFLLFFICLLLLFSVSGSVQYYVDFEFSHVQDCQFLILTCFSQHLIFFTFFFQLTSPERSCQLLFQLFISQKFSLKQKHVKKIHESIDMIQTFQQNSLVCPQQSSCLIRNSKWLQSQVNLGPYQKQIQVPSSQKLKGYIKHYCICL